MADIALAGKLFVPHYASPEPRVASKSTLMRSGPQESAEQVAELDANGAFFLLDVIGDWGWGYRGGDHLVGYVRTADLLIPPA